MRFLAEFIMRGKGQAIAVTSFFALLSLILPPISIVSSAAVALVSLRKGAYQGLWILLGASLACAVLGVVVLGSFQFAFGYALVLWLPVWLLSFVLREGRNLSLVLEISVALGVLAVSGFYFFMDSPALYWYKILQVVIQPMVAASDIPMEAINNTIAILSQYMTGVLAIGSVTSLLLGLLLARWWQANLYNPGGFGAEYLMLKMPFRFAVATGITLLLASISDGLFSEMAWNIGIILFMAYTFVGMAVVHTLIQKITVKFFLLPVFYTLFFVVPQVVVPVAIIGISDTWLNLRKI